MGLGGVGVLVGMDVFVGIGEGGIVTVGDGVIGVDEGIIGLDVGTGVDGGGRIVGTDVDGGGSIVGIGEVGIVEGTEVAVDISAMAVEVGVGIAIS